jgi:hypothetical protein
MFYDETGSQAEATQRSVLQTDRKHLQGTGTENGELSKPLDVDFKGTDKQSVIRNDCCQGQD